MQHYSYRGAARLRVWWSKFLGVAVALSLSALSVFFVAGALQGKASNTLTCLAIWCLLLGWILGLFFFNSFPSVTVGDNGLEFDFLWWKIHLNWSDVIGLKSHDVQWPGFALVIAKRATPFHMLYSWYFARILKPGFLITDSMEGYAELLDTIRRKARVV